MRVKLVKITDCEGGWKGTWYKNDQLHFVTENNADHIACKFQAIDISGGIMANHCEVQTGFIAWLK